MQRAVLWRLGPTLNRDVPWDVGMGLIANHFEILKAVLVNRGGLAVDPQRGQGVRLPGKLQEHLVEVIFIDMHISSGPDKFARFQPALLGQHGQQQCIAGQVERQSDKHIAGPLIELQMQPTLADRRLEQAVAGCQGHGRQVARVPRADNLSAGGGIMLYFRNQGGDLVDMTPVRTDPIPPLLAIHWTQIAVLVGPFIPNGNLVLLQIRDIGVAVEKPEQFIDDRAQVELFGGHQRETQSQVKAHLVAKHGQRPNARAVGLFRALVQNAADQVMIRFHGVASGVWPSIPGWR